MALVLEVEAQVAAGLLRRLLQVRHLDRRRRGAFPVVRLDPVGRAARLVDVRQCRRRRCRPRRRRRPRSRPAPPGRSPRRPRSRPPAASAPSSPARPRVPRAPGGAVPALPPCGSPSASPEFSQSSWPGLAAPPRGPLPGPRRAQRAEHGPRRRRPVQRVEVDARRAAEQQLGALLRGVGDAELELGPLVARGGAERLLQQRRDRGVAELADPLRLGEAGDRDDPGEDRHLDPLRARRRDEVEVDPVVEEELGDQEGGPGLDLRLQVGEVGLEVGRLGVDLGEAGAADREVPAGGDEGGQLGGAAQPALGLDEVRLARAAGRRAARRRSRSPPPRSGRGSPRGPRSSRRRSSGAPSSRSRARP